MILVADTGNKWIMQIFSNIFICLLPQSIWETSIKSSVFWRISRRICLIFDLYYISCLSSQLQDLTFSRPPHAHNQMLLIYNRPLALRGHVTNASFKEWVRILLMPKVERAHKNYLTPEIWEEKHLRKTFYGTLIFQQSSISCIGRHVGGHTLALQYGGQNYFLLISC